jgi:acyl-CoA thioesterase
LRTISAVYAAPVGPGPVEIEVSVLRRGRSVSQVLATLRNPGAEAGLTAIAAFGGERASYEFRDLVMPEVPAPGPPRPITARDPDAWNPFWEPGGMASARALGSTSAADWHPTSRNGAWHRLDDPPMRADGTLDPLAVVVHGDLMGSGVWERMGWDVQLPRTVTVSADLTVHVLAPARSSWMLSVVQTHAVGDGYESVGSSIWDERGTLVAVSTGLLILSFPDGPPADELRRPPA